MPPDVEDPHPVDNLAAEPSHVHPAATTIGATSIAAAPPPPTPPREFTAGRATAFFFLVMASQIVSAIYVAAAAALYVLAQSIAGQPVTGDPRVITALLTPPLLLASVVVAGIVSYALARAWVWHAGDPASSEAIGIRRSTTTQLLLAFAAGLAIAAIYLFGFRLGMLPSRDPSHMGPLSQLAAREGLARVAWTIVAVLLAPPIEEFMFRGVMLRGFAASWGLRTSALVVSILFLLTHFPEIGTYWPGALAISCLAAGTVLARIWSGSIAPAIALHTGYNLALVVMLYSSGT